MANPAPEVINLDEDVPPAINVGGNNNRSNRFDRIAFVYPESGGNSAIQVRESDVSRLNPNQQISENKYLSDTNIDFIGKHIVASTANLSLGYRPFVCSSLFDSHLNSLFRYSSDSGQVSTTWYEEFIH